MLGVIKALTDVRNYIKELKTYFGLKNQTLFTGTWTTGTKTITKRFVQYHNKWYFNNSFCDGFQKQLCYKIYPSGSLDCNRQSIVQRGCCYV